MHLTGLDLLFWALSFAGHCTLLAVLLLRHRAGSFPIFTTLISSDVLRTIILYLILRSGTTETYFYAYWTLALVDVTLQIAVGYELAAHVFRPLGAWAPDAGYYLFALLGLSLLIAAALTALAAPPTQNLRQTVVIRGNFFSSVLVSELFVAMVALSVTMGLPWRTHAARLAQGLGTYSIFAILTEGAHSYFGSHPSQTTYAFFSHLRISIYLVCLSYWIVALVLDEPLPRKMPEELRQELRALQRRAALLLRNMRTTGITS